MRRTDTSEWPCNIARGANILADLWNVLLIRQACLGTRRYEDFQRALGIGRNILTIRLNGLVDEGILERFEYQTNPVRHEYRLTDKGRDLYGVTVAIMRWGDRWLTADPPLLLTHRTDGGAIEQELRCARCGQELGPRDVAYERTDGSDAGARP